MIQVEVNVKAIEDRYKQLSKLTPSTKIIPVIKNNCNGLGIETMAKVFDKLTDIVATSYAEEILPLDIEARKLAWIWDVESYSRLYHNATEKQKAKVELVCKELDQVQFCYDNNIPIHLAFNIGMNRGGFTLTDIKSLCDIIKDYNYPLYLTTHCPAEDRLYIEDYEERFWKLFETINEYSTLKITEFNTHYTNSAVFKTLSNDKPFLGGYARLGEHLLLPKTIEEDGENYNPVTVSTKIAHIQKVAAGETVGYQHYKASRDMTVAVLPVGYYNFDNINTVYCPKTSTKFKVLAQMHDTTIIRIPDGFNLQRGDEIVLLNNKLMYDNWNKCIQRTFKFNPDLVQYKYK